MVTKIEKLQCLERKAELIAAKLGRFEIKRKHALSSLAADKWLQTCCKRPLLSFDKFEANKLRTSIGLCGEELMKILLMLDQIQSEGDEEVLHKRRALVKKINGEILPEADEKLVLAQAVASLYNRIKRIKSSRRERLKLQYQQEQQTMEAQMEEEKRNNAISDSESESSDNESIINEEEDSPPRMEQHSESLRRVPSSSEADHSPSYRITENEDYSIVDIVLPLSESADELTFQVHKYNHELLVQGKYFELPLQVSPSKYVLNETRVKILSEQHLKIYIPKRLYSQHMHPRHRYANPWAQPESFFQPRYYGSSFYNR